MGHRRVKEDGEAILAPPDSRIEPAYKTEGFWPIRTTDEIYNAKVSGASSPEKPKEVSPTKKLLPSSQFHPSFFTGSTQVTLLHFHYGEYRNVIKNPARLSSSK